MLQPHFDSFLIKDINLFKSLETYASKVDSPYLVVDVETNSKIEKLAKLYGIGLAFTKHKAFYIPWCNPDGSFFWTETEMTTIKTWLAHIFSVKKIVNHNIIYDTLVIENNLGIVIDDYIYSDTILQRHCLEEDGPFALKEIAVMLLGPWADKAQEILKAEVVAAGGRWTKDQKDMYLASTNTLGEYCCWDTILTIILFEMFEEELIKEGLYDLFYKDEVMPLYKTFTINSKRKGFPIDVAYYENLKVQISREIDSVEDSIMASVSKDITAFEQDLLNDHYPIKDSGNFPVAYAEVANIPIPVNVKTGKPTLAAKAIKQQMATSPQFTAFYEFVLGEKPASSVLNANLVYKTQKKMFFANHPDKRYVFNLSSTDHLIELMCNKWGLQTIEKTDGGKPKIDDDFLETLRNSRIKNFVEMLLDYKKLNKLLSTYVEGILDRQIDGRIYTSMLQYGTTSGRFSSRDPNLQNQPRIKDEDSGLSPLVLSYVNAIRMGFIAGPGMKVVNADYASLEPVCFAHVSGDEKLKDVFRNGEDLYSRVAIETFNLLGVSAKKSDPNYLKNIMPEKRQTAKTIALAIPYGAEAARIAEELGIKFKEAQDIIDNYLNGFPDLKKYMSDCNYNAKTEGKVKTEFGRIRHLKEAKSIYTLYGDRVLDWKYARNNGVEDIRRKFKNSLNNSKNFPIQGLASHIVNRAMIAIAREFKKHNIEGWIALQVHDEITCIVREDQAQLVSDIMRRCMEKTTLISVPLVAEPLIADNWGSAK